MSRLLIQNTVGVELEYWGHTDLVAAALSVDGWCNESQHSYHCDCAECRFTTGLLWRYQRDSTVSGEFISRILGDWATAHLAFNAMEAAIQRANKRPKGTRGQFRSPVQVTLATGLHVHVDQRAATWETLVSCYLLFERWMQRIGSGPFPDKREGMNITFLGALRERGFEPGNAVSLNHAASEIMGQVSDDRHIDLNLSRNTFEFRVYNSVLEAWQMELAVRMSLAFCTFSNEYYEHNAICIPARPIQTLQPPVPLAVFIDYICRYDHDLRPLIERQLALYEPRGDENAQPEPAPDPQDVPEPEPMQDDGWVSLPGCTCPDCAEARACRTTTLSSPSQTTTTWRPARREARPWEWVGEFAF